MKSQRVSDVPGRLKHIHVGGGHGALVKGQSDSVRRTRSDVSFKVTGSTCKPPLMSKRNVNSRLHDKNISFKGQSLIFGASFHCVFAIFRLSVSFWRKLATNMQTFTVIRFKFDQRRMCYF